MRGAIGEMSVPDVSEITGISVSALRNWIRGEGYKRPDLWNVCDFAMRLALPLQEALDAAGFPLDQLLVQLGVDRGATPGASTTSQVLTEIHRLAEEELVRRGTIPGNPSMVKRKGVARLLLGNTNFSPRYDRPPV